MFDSDPIIALSPRRVVRRPQLIHRRCQQSRSLTRSRRRSPHFASRTSRQSARFAITYDAWNRATSIRGTTYVYDALGRRIWESANGGRAFFYDGQRMIETRLGAANALATNAHEQYVYGQGYIDDVVLRDAEVNGGGNLGISGSGLDQRLYYQQDREFNVVALTDQSGNVIERYAYDPYGSQSALKPDWSLWTEGDGPDYANQVGFTGRWLDETGMWYFRARYEEPVLGRFISRDPKGYEGDGDDLYCAYFVPQKMDSTGLCGCGPNVTQSVDDVLMKVDNDWNGWTKDNQLSHCEALFNAKTANEAWDIAQLEAKGGQNALQVDAEKAGCAKTDECKNSVEYKGQCYYSGSLNYILFGHICKLCAQIHATSTATTPAGQVALPINDLTMALAIQQYKGPRGQAGQPGYQAGAPNFVPSLQMAQYGYSGQNQPKGDRPGCTLGCTMRVPKFGYYWVNKEGKMY